MFIRGLPYVDSGGVGGVVWLTQQGSISSSTEVPFELPAEIPAELLLDLLREHFKLPELLVEGDGVSMAATASTSIFFVLLAGYLSGESCRFCAIDIPKVSKLEVCIVKDI